LESNFCECLPANHQFICCSTLTFAALTLAVLTTRNETWRLWKRISNFYNSNFMACNFKQAFYLLHKLYIAWIWLQKYF